MTFRWDSYYNCCQFRNKAIYLDCLVDWFIWGLLVLAPSMTQIFSCKDSIRCLLKYAGSKDLPKSLNKPVCCIVAVTSTRIAECLAPQLYLGSK